MKKKVIGYTVTIIIIAYILLFNFSLNKTLEDSDEFLINDISRLNPTHIKKVVKNTELEGLQESLREARENNLKVSIAGKRHSMGGHAFYDSAVVLDMTYYNKILNLDKENKIITVQSGATWKDVIEYLNPHDLSVAIMQGYNTFTIGGSMSVNVHESDPKFGAMIESIRSFRLLLADGSVVEVSRTENPELFNLVIGGYGLFGVILNADLDVVDNNIYNKNEYQISYDEYPALFKEVTSDSNVELVYARLSIANDDTLLRELIATTYEVTDTYEEVERELQPNKNVALKKFIFGLSRKYDWGKKFRWYIQKKHTYLEFPYTISRNNLINGDPKFLEYYKSKNTDILQEYFIPVDNLPQFLDGLRDTIIKHDVNFLSITLRHVPENNESFLAYSKETDKFGAVLYFNVGTSDEEQEKTELWTRELIDITHKLNGAYYLPYKLYASQEQIRMSYPNIDKFFELKRKYDPNELFMNKFYAKYALGDEDYEGY
jgi:decaprenylphospho-beta-D-ribofuranose 2-oxidase